MTTDRAKIIDKQQRGMSNDVEEFTALPPFKAKGFHDIIKYAYNNLNDQEWKNKSTIAKENDVAKRSFRRHVDTAIEMGIVESRPIQKRGKIGEEDYDGNITLYRPNQDSIVLAAIVELELATRGVKRERESDSEQSTLGDNDNE